MSNDYLEQFNKIVENIKKSPKNFNKSKIYKSFFNYIKLSKLREFPANILNIQNNRERSKKEKLYIILM